MQDSKGSTFIKRDRNPKVSVILASQSPSRRRLLKRLLLDLGDGFHPLRFRAISPNLDEEAVARKYKEPTRIVRELSKLKARTVSEREPSAIVIGGDQVLVHRGRIYGKPHTEEGAIRQLLAFAGGEVKLLTGVCIRHGSYFERTFIHVTKMKFRALTLSEIRAYVRRDQPLGSAGSFKFESFGIGLFMKVSTTDPTAIEGLPLIRLGRLLRSAVAAAIENA